MFIFKMKFFFFCIMFRFVVVIKFGGKLREDNIDRKYILDNEVSLECVKY